VLARLSCSTFLGGLCSSGDVLALLTSNVLGISLLVTLATQLLKLFTSSTKLHLEVLHSHLGLHLHDLKLSLSGRRCLSDSSTDLSLFFLTTNSISVSSSSAHKGI